MANGRLEKLTEVLHVRVTQKTAEEIYRRSKIRYNGDISEFLRDRLIDAIHSPEPGEVQTIPVVEIPPMVTAVSGPPLKPERKSTLTPSVSK